MSSADEYRAKLQAARDELATAGAIHAKDLRRQIKRMEKELRIYDRYRKTACVARERAACTSGQEIHSGRGSAGNGQ